MVLDPKKLELLEEYITNLWQIFQPSDIERKDRKLVEDIFKVEIPKIKPCNFTKFIKNPQYNKKLDELKQLLNNKYKTTDFIDNFIYKYLNGNLPYYYQLESFIKIFEENSQFIFIEAPTGFGKSECVILPIAYDLIMHPNTIAIFVYPRKLLIDDQAKRFLKIQHLVSSLDIDKKSILLPFIKKTGVYKDLQTTINSNKKDKEILEVDSQNIYLKHIECPLCNNKLKLEVDYYNILKYKFVCKKDLQHQFLLGITSDFLLNKLKLKKLFNNNVSLIILTTLESLFRLQTYDTFDYILKRCKYIVIDEAHIYESIYGAHLSEILSRILEKNKDIKIIFLSATLPNVENFIRKILKLPKEKIDKSFAHIKIQENLDYEIDNKYKEYWFFILASGKKERKPKARSTLIQLQMLINHTLLPYYNVQFKDFNNLRTVAFFESKDTLYFTYLQFYDAEIIRKLWKYRFFDENIIKYNEQNWKRFVEDNLKILEEAKKEVDKKDIKIVTSELKEKIENNVKNIFATAAFELGIDDQYLFSYIQFHAPYRLQSFVQRLGRIRRFPYDRFIFLIFENDYINPYDAYYYYQCKKSFENNDYPIYIKASCKDTFKINEKIYEIPIASSNELIAKFYNYLTEILNEYFRVKTNIHQKKIYSLLLAFHNFVKKKYLYMELEIDNKYIEILDEIRNELEKEKGKISKILNIIEYHLKEFSNVVDIYSARSDVKEFVTTIKHDNSARNIINMLINMFKLNVDVNIIINILEKISEGVPITNREKQIIINFAKNLERKFPCIDRNKIKSILLCVEYSRKNNNEDTDRKECIYLALQNIKNAISLERNISMYERILYLLRSLFWATFMSKNENKRILYAPKALFKTDYELPILVVVKDNLGIIKNITERDDGLYYLFYKYLPLKPGTEILDKRKIPKPAFLVPNKVEIKNSKKNIIVWNISKKIKGKSIDKNTIQPYKIEVNIISKEIERLVKKGKILVCRNCLMIYTEKVNNCRVCGGIVEQVYVNLTPLITLNLNDHKEVIDNIILGKLQISIIKTMITKILKGVEVYKRNTKEKFMIFLKPKIGIKYPAKAIKIKIENLNIDIENEKEIALHGLAHIILKLISTYTGTYPEDLDYVIDENENSIYIIEGYPGGVGVSEAFFEALRDYELLQKFIKDLNDLLNHNHTNNIDGCPICIWIKRCNKGFYWQFRKLKFEPVKKIIADILNSINDIDIVRNVKTFDFDNR